MNLIQEISLFAEPVARIGKYAVTNSMLASWVAAIIIIIFSLSLRFKLKEIPRGMQNLFEMLVEGAFSLIDQVTGDRKLSEKVFPIALPLFLFILLNNWIGLMPLGWVGQVEHTGKGFLFVPYLRGGSADVNTTIALAVMSVLAANLFGVLSIGIWKVFNKYVNIKVLSSIPGRIKKDLTVVIVAPITFFVGLIEIIGEIAKMVSLAFRLFGNIFAGEVLLYSMAALIPYIVPVPFLFLELLMTSIQALIFAMLVVVYFTISASEHGHEDETDVRKEQEEIKEVLSAKA